eukprot:366213-Chlamydomonas_euryale.AAC.8
MEERVVSERGSEGSGFVGGDGAGGGALPALARRMCMRCLLRWEGMRCLLHWEGMRCLLHWEGMRCPLRREGMRCLL